MLQLKHSSSSSGQLSPSFPKGYLREADTEYSALLPDEQYPSGYGAPSMLTETVMSRSLNPERPALSMGTKPNVAVK